MRRRHEPGRAGAGRVDRRDAIAKLFDAFPIGWNGELRVVATAANRQPAMATHIRPPGGSAFELAALTVMRVEGGRIVELTNFAPALLRGFGLPQRLDHQDGRHAGRVRPETSVGRREDR
jgi:hypothetical protein